MHNFRVGDRVRILLEGNVSKIDEDGVSFLNYRTGELHYWTFDDVELVPQVPVEQREPDEREV